MDLFIKPIEQYERSVDIIGNYQRDMALCLSKMYGKSYDDCYEFVRKTITSGPLALKDPQALVLVRQKNGDRKKVTTSLQGFLSDVYNGNEILSPSMTSYLSPDVKESLLGKYVAANLLRRSVAKKEAIEADMQAQKAQEFLADAEAHGDTLCAEGARREVGVWLQRTAMYEGIQTSLKIKNNSLSGAHVSEHTILFNKSAHSTLTSTCRATASYGNANNEKFIMGNRHYWCPDAVMANVVSIIGHTDLPALKRVMDRFNLHYPTVDETMELILYSSDLYWRNIDGWDMIRQLINSLEPLERAAFAYVGDMYHLAKYNDAFMREFIGKLVNKATVPCEEPEAAMKTVDGDMKAYVSLLCAKELDGETIKDCQKKRPDDYGKVAGTAKNTMDALHWYADLITCLWVSDNMPADVAFVPTMIRRCAITSDTDSTIFTVQYWTQWYVGKLDFTDTSNAVAATVVYLASQSIRHILAQLTANLGVVPRHRGMLQMKNEFMFPVFSLTSRAKHYYAYVSAREGNVFKKMKTEIKGVGLRGSSVPAEIMVQAKNMMTGIMDTVLAGKLISYAEQLKLVGDVERQIASSIDSGEYKYFSTTSIKGPESYKMPMSSNYIHYEMWEDVFADKYGHTEAPPYQCVKVSINADNPTKVKAWLALMEDPAIAAKMQAWLEKRQKKDVSMLLLPHTVLSTCGIPKEIICGIDKRTLISGLTDSFYLILESLGLYIKNTQLTRIASDIA